MTTKEDKQEGLTKKIAVFGATGDTGRQIVEQALQEEYDVVAYTRNPSKLKLNNDHLLVIEGELSDAGLIETAIKGTSAVLSALGPRGGSKDKPLTQECKILLQQ